MCEISKFKRHNFGQKCIEEVSAKYKNCEYVFSANIFVVYWKNHNT